MANILRAVFPVPVTDEGGSDWAAESPGTLVDIEPVKAVADALDRVRIVCSDVGVATLLAQIHDVAGEVLCAALDDLANAAEQAIRTLEASWTTSEETEH